MNDPRLEALLAEAVPPPVPGGLAERVAATAGALPQEQRPARGWRVSGRDRRGAWLRRPLLGGAIALGLAFSGAVAATLAGVPLPAKVEAVMAQIPFVGRKAAEPEHAPVRHAAARPVPRPAPMAPADFATAAADPLPMNLTPRPAEIRRMILANGIVARRQAMGLPSPPVAQVERMIHRRQMLRRWQRATPEQRQAFLANHPHFAATLAQRQAFLADHPQAIAQIGQRQALRDATPEQRQAFLATHPQAQARMAQRQALRDATPEQRQAFLAAHPEIRARIEQRQALRDATPEQRQAFLAAHPEIRAQMEQRRALRDATPEQREAFFAAHPRARARFEARRAARQGIMPQSR